MYTPGANRLDGTLLLRPIDYITRPASFGWDDKGTFVVADGGDERSRRVALIQHVAIVRWRADGRAAAALAHDWDVSTSTMSRTLRGERWAGQLILAALIAARDRG
jgi:hypothetical protein